MNATLNIQALGLSLALFGASLPAFAQSAVCTAPGPVLVSDPANDQTGGAANAALDILSVAFAEPNFPDDIRRLTITLKVASLATLPASASWRVEFSHGGTIRFVSMNTSAESPAPTYEYGTSDGTSLTTGGALHSSSSYQADGTITLVVNASAIGNPAPGAALTAIGGVTTTFIGVAGTGGFLSVDDTDGTPSYTMAAANACPKADSDGDGVTDSQDACPMTPAGAEVLPNGCPVVRGDADGDGVVDDKDACPMTPAGTPVDADGCPFGQPEKLLYFHGNLHDGCSGVGQNDFVICDGPLLGDEVLDSNPAARFDYNSLGSTGAKGPYDANWTWTADAATTLDGAVVVKFWASCNATCLAFGGEWAASLWLDGVKVAPAGDADFLFAATPTTPDVPELLAGSFKLAAPINIPAGAELTLKLENNFIDSGQNSRIYYDSTLGCVAGSTGPCNSLVLFNARDTDRDGVPDLLDKCQATPLGTDVDAEGCPLQGACTAGAAAAAEARTPSSGFISVDRAVRDDLARLRPADRYGAFVHFFRQGTHAQQDAAVASAGLKVLHDFRRYGTFVFVEGPAVGFQALARLPGIRRIEKNRALRYLDATQSWATRARMAQETVADGPWRDANGDVITGKGITLGIIDSGMFGAHPDFGGLDRISHNYKLISPVGGPVYYQDVGIGDSENGGGGHGTHVSGTAAGGGNQSDGGYPDPAVSPYFPGTFAAAAPDVKILHWGNGAAIFVLNVMLAYQHMLDNIGLPEFATLKAVNNSYGDEGGTPYNGDDADKQLIKQIVGCGVNMVFSAGNDGGDGSADLTNSTCKDPTPGVICVASYNDQGTGTLNGPLSAFSSRSKQGIAQDYVDIASPGDLTTSTCAQATPTQAICTGGDDAEAETEWQPWYGTISGTSMASPNITSILGLIAQADPLLTPAEREDILKDTARKVGSGYEPDPRNPGQTTHFGFGAGLVNTQAALESIGVTKSPLPAAGEPWTIFVADADPALSGAADVVGLVMQEYADSAGNHGVKYQIAVRDLAAFGSSTSIAYRIEQNVNGQHYESTVLATAAGVTIPEPGAGNTAPAVSVGRVGNEIHVKVAYSALGYPPLLAPIHNIAVFSSDQTGALDFAPSPAGSTGAQATLQPMYGRAFTVRQPVSLPDDTTSVCVVPGKTKLRDDPGDQVQTPPGIDAPYDLLSVHVAEPGEGPFANQVVFTMKMRGLATVPSGTRWVLRFNGPKPPPAGQDDFFVMMTTEQGATPTFVYGTTGVTSDPSGTAGARTFQIEGDLDPASNYNADGTIQLVVPRDNTLFGPLLPGDTLIKIVPTVRAPATPNNNAIYDTGGEFEHTLVDPLTCLLPRPLAELVADITSGRAPLTVMFDASGSSSENGDIVSYTFDFGDGTDPVTQVTPWIEHVYAEAGTYVASVRVLDELDLLSTNEAEVTIEALPNLPPQARAGADFSVSEGATALLSGSSSTDPDGDVLSYQWSQVGTPAVTLDNANSAMASFVAPAVTVDTPLVFQLRVTDPQGLSTTDTITITVLEVPTPPVQLGESTVGAVTPAGLLALALSLLVPRRRRRD